MRRRALIAIPSLVLAACSSDDAASPAPVVTVTVTVDDATNPTATEMPDVGTDPPGSSTPADSAVDAAMSPIGRADLRPSGNRVVDGVGAITSTDAVMFDLGTPAAWIVPLRGDGVEPGAGWLVVDESGEVHELVLDVESGSIAVTTRSERVDPTAGPPVWGDGTVSSGPDPDLVDFDDALPDSRVVTGGQGERVALVEPTERYGHGVLGDAVEAAGFEVIEPDSSGAGSLVRTRVILDEPDVIEAIAPMLADVDDDGVDDVVVTLANADDGARLAVFSRDGSPLAESPPIGRGNRWRNLLAVAPTGPNGEIEIIDVRTPHIGGTLQFFQLESSDGEPVLERVAAADGYTTHAIGSRNLDLGIVADGDGDGRLDVILPTQDRRTLHVVTRADDAPTGTAIVGTIDFDAAISTNVAAESVGGDVTFAVGTRDGVVHLFPAPG